MLLLFEILCNEQRLHARTDAAAPGCYGSCIGAWAAPGAPPGGRERLSAGGGANAAAAAASPAAVVAAAAAVTWEPL